MAFIKLNRVRYEQRDTDGYKFFPNGTAILNSSHIIDIYIIENAKLSTEAEKKYSEMFDIASSELCVLRIDLIDNNYCYVIIPRKKYEEYKN